ncbi:phospho-sugar mutase [Guggenheimella bovis]
MYQEIYEAELKSPIYDEEYKNELRKLSPEEIKESFYKELSFGTAGIRGKMGPGTNRLNRYIILRVSYAVARWVNDLSKDPVVVIAYDSRLNSDVFSKEAARALASYGVKVYLFPDYASTPELSFAVRHLKATAGIVITASHNPREYNGFKVYHSSGRQVLEKEANEILKYYNEMKDLSKLELLTFHEHLQSGKIDWTPRSVWDDYDQAIQDAMKFIRVKETSYDLTVVYTPLHGTGARAALKALKSLGVNVVTVPSQIEPDGTFPEVEVANPENPSVFEVAKSLGYKHKADLLIATDPDADRLGAMVLHGGEYVFIDGNQMGALMLDYLLERGLSGNVVTTIVSSLLIDRIAEGRVPVERTLTGFKYIGEAMNQNENFLLGFEESFGYLNALHARDKDGINALMLVSEMAIFAKTEGMTLVDRLENIYKRFGYSKEGQIVLTLDGIEGQEKIASLMERFRNEGISSIAGRKVLHFTDFLKDDTGLPKENVLKWIFEKDTWIAMRPSGTEPKLKIYIGASSASREETEEALKTIREELQEKLQ